MKITQYLKTACPYCGRKDHKCYSVNRWGCMVIRYHKCKCGERFRSRETATGTDVYQGEGR
jgi:hypothetical protein